MRRRRNVRHWSASIARCAVIGLVALPIAIAGAQDAPSIAQNGNSNGAPACTSCHGEHGEGNTDAGYPRLSGLARDYILHQLESFGNGSRPNDTMQPVAKALGDEARKGLAAYYADRPVLQRPASVEAPDDKLLARGKVLAENGDWSKGVPGCGQCHGPVGRGVGASFPALAGQPASYLSAQLAAWKSKKRKNDALGLMAGLAGKLSEHDIDAASAYYASLPVPNASGGTAR
jgi:cytochrome c553